MKISPSTKNNFNILRLLAALQVVLGHSIEHLYLKNQFVLGFYDNFLRFFPGVPIFFFLSGFLIFWSFDRNSKNLKKYFFNRIVRIFPGLWFCFILTVFVLYFTFEKFNYFLDSKDFFLWSLAQISFFQFYTPDALRLWGVGNPNGSLWTIIVELQFYLLIPLIYRVVNFKRNILWILIVISVFCNFYINTLDENLTVKLLKVSILPYLYYFLIGVFVYREWLSFRKVFKFNFFKYLIIFLIFSLIGYYFLNLNTYSYWVNSPLKLLADLLLCILVFSFGYSFKSLNGFLKGYDISYGIYIYHMVVINIFVEFNLMSRLYYLVLVVVLTILLALFSWIFIEKPFLQLKSYYR